MFSKNQTTDKKSTTTATLISAGTELKGDIHSDIDLRIDGTILGHVTSTAKIVVGPTGFVQGNVDGKQADITGKVIGDIAVEENIQLRSNSFVQGNIAAANIQVDTGAVFNGYCQVGGGAHIVSMKEADAHAQAQ